MVSISAACFAFDDFSGQIDHHLAQRASVAHVRAYFLVGAIQHELLAWVTGVEFLQRAVGHEDAATDIGRVAGNRAHAEIALDHRQVLHQNDLMGDQLVVFIDGVGIDEGGQGFAQARQALAATRLHFTRNPVVFLVIGVDAQATQHQHAADADQRDQNRDQG